MKDLTGEVFDDLVALNYVGIREYSDRKLHIWECVCKCGNTIQRTVPVLRSKTYNSCGCKDSKGNKKLLCGFGINNANYKLSERVLLEDGSTRYTWRCPYYEVWASMIKRCYSGKNPAYEGCTVNEEWRYFMNFRSWMEKQDWEGKRLDKDLLALGNKEYSSRNCVFVSNRVNCFLTKCNSDTGYSWNKEVNKYQARVNDPLLNREVALGYYCTAEEAKGVWLNAKLSVGVKLVEEEILPRQIIDLLTNKERLCQYLNTQC